MKRLLFLTLLTALIMSFSMDAQEKKFVRVYADSKEVPTLFTEHFRQDALRRADQRKVLPISTNLLGGVGRLWTDGINIICTLYFDDQHVIEVMREYANDVSHPMEIIDSLTVRKGVVTQKRGGSKFTVEQMGNYKMLVQRDAQGAVVNAFYSISLDEFNNGQWTMFMHYMLAGNYRISTNENSIFGPKLAHYNSDKYCHDPGIFSYAINLKSHSVDIEYGEGRVSHGDPSSPKYGKMPGGGGAAAIMGPMLWNVKPTVEGLQVKVLRDEKFVDHFPRVKDGSMLTKLECPYEGIDGKWAFASVIPLTPAMLSIFPKEVLTLMRGEIYARHGDTFENPETQRYFDAQPWYKRSDKKVVLTDIEKFNYAMIKFVENGSKTWKKFNK